MFVVIFSGITLTPTFSSFNPFPFLSSVAKDDRKPFQSLNIVLYNKTGHYFWNSVDSKTFVSFLKRKHS